MIEVTCFTNLDIRETWPDELPCKPAIGEIIEGERGIRLEICAITYKQKPPIMGEYGKQSWMLHLELKPPYGMSPDQFHLGPGQYLDGEWG